MAYFNAVRKDRKTMTENNVKKQGNIDFHIYFKRFRVLVLSNSIKTGFFL